MLEAIQSWLKGLFTEPPSTVLQLGVLYVEAFLAIIASAWRGLAMLIRWLRPQRPGLRGEWIAQANPTPKESNVFGQEDANPNNAWRRDRGRWTHGKTMGKRDWFNLFLDKPRVLSRVILKHSGQNDDQSPLKTAVFVKKNKEQGDWESYNTYAQWPIDIKFPKPRKIQGLRLVIEEPRLTPIGSAGYPPAWGIQDIEIEEVTLFGLYRRFIR